MKMCVACDSHDEDEKSLQLVEGVTVLEDGTDEMHVEMWNQASPQSRGTETIASSKLTVFLLLLR